MAIFPQFMNMALGFPYSTLKFMLLLAIQLVKMIWCALGGKNDLVKAPFLYPKPIGSP